MNRGFMDYGGLSAVVPLKISTLRKMVSRGNIPYLKLGSRVFFDPDEIQKWIDDRRVPAEKRGHDAARST